MRKILFIAMCVAGLAAASCQKKDIDTPSNEVKVTMALNVEESGVDQLAYAVFDEENNLVSELQTVANAFKSTSAKISLKLNKGETYTVAFWAQDSACKAFTVVAADGGMSIDVKADASTGDAYFGTETFSADKSAEIPVQLSRSFAQINPSVKVSKVVINAAAENGFIYTANVTNGEGLKAALADRDVTEIILADGEYEGVYVHNTTEKVVRAATGATATFKGVFGVAASIEFHDINFVASDASNEETGHQYLDRFQRKSVVPIYAAQAKFYNCNFTDVYNSHNVAAINYGAHKKGVKLIVDGCSFQGYAYTIYSRALIEVTNCTFNQIHPQHNPRAIFLYGLGDDSQGSVVFKNNKAVGKTSYTMEMSSANYNYKGICYDVQNNSNFEVDGQAFLPRVEPGWDFTGTTFAEGSAEFVF